MAVETRQVNEQNNQFFIQSLAEMKLEEDNEKLNELLRLLKDYLRKLSSWMATKKTSETLKELPSTGKLLSHVCKICKSHHNASSLSEILVGCILNFAQLPSSLKISKSDKLQRWAVEHLQACTASCIDEDDAMLMDHFGISQKEVVDAQAQEVSSMIYDLESEDFVFNVQQKDSQLWTLSQMVLPFLDEPRIKCVVESIIIAHEKSHCRYWFNSKNATMPTNCASGEFFESLISKKETVRGLSDESILSLWRSHLPAFECEVLELAKSAISRPFVDNTSLRRLLEAQGKLICLCCARDFTFYDCAFDILRESLRSFGLYPTLVSLINNLYINIRKEQSKNETMDLQQRLFMALPFSPGGSLPREHEMLITMLAEEIKEAQQPNRFDRTDIWFALVQNKHFLDISLQISLHESTSFLDRCLEVLCWFHFPSHHPKIKRIFVQLVTSLRCLLRKKILQMADFSYLINACKKRMPEGVDPMPLLRDVIFQFFIDADASHYILREAFSQITSDLSYESKLDLWLRTFEEYLLKETWDEKSTVKKIRFCNEKKSTFLILIAALLDRITKRQSMNEKPESPNEGSHFEDLIHRADKISNFIKSNL